MSNQDSEVKTDVESSADVRPDLDGEEYRDSTHYRPISTSEYFKVLFYCVAGLVAVAMVFILLTIVFD